MAHAPSGARSSALGQCRRQHGALKKIDTVKTEAGVRQVPLFDELAEYLAPLRGIGHAITGGRSHSYLSKSSYVDKWNALMVAVYEQDKTIERRNLNEKKKDAPPLYASILTAHYFRHNFASVLYNADVDVITAQKILGHKDIKTTLGIYAHLSKSKEMREVTKIQRKFSGLPEGCQGGGK